jgi:hypothetical protein
VRKASEEVGTTGSGIRIASSDAGLRMVSGLGMRSHERWIAICSLAE